MLSDAKRDAKARINAARDEEEANGFEAFGKIFDSDQRAIQRISLTVQAAQLADDSFSVDWTCKDNSVITLSKAQVIMLPAIMAQAANAMHVKARLLKSEIDAAGSIESVALVKW